MHPHVTRVFGRSWFTSVALAGSLLVGCGGVGDVDPAELAGAGGGQNNAAGGAGIPSGNAGSGNPGGGAAPAGGNGSAGTSNPGGGAAPAGGMGSGGAAPMGDGIGSTEPSGSPTLPNGRGATMPFITYEAENGTLKGGMALGPTRAVNSTNDTAAEASNRKAVRLSAMGDSVEWKTTAPTNSIVVRYSIPDNGLDYKTTLSVFVDGTFKQKLNVTSRYSWSYGGPNDFANLGVQKNKGAGSPHHFWDDARALLGDVPAGATIAIKKDTGDAAAYYDVDFIDLEQAPAALNKPAGFVSVADCGAVPNDDKDDTAAFNTCFGKTKSLYIPEGTFNLTTKELSVQGVTVRGAGMWRSTLKGFFARFDCWKAGCKFYDFAMDGDTTARNDAAPETAFTGNGMSGSVIEHIWVEHKKVGIWTGDNTNGLSVRNSRFRNLHADGINLACGTKNAIVEHVHVRNTGDDAFANWSLNKCAATSGNVFRHTFAQLPWRANCFGLYGGGSSIEDSVCMDTPQYPGILIGRMFDAVPFTATKVSGVTLSRTGGPMYGEQGAIKLNSEQGDLQNIQVSNVDIDSSTFSSIHFAGNAAINTVSFSNVKITGGGCGILAQNNGAADMANVSVTGAASAMCNEKGFNFIKGAGNSGW